MTDDEQLGRNILVEVPSLLTHGLDKFCEHIGRRARELLARPAATRDAVHAIRLTAAEIQSGHDRVKWAEGLIRQLPLTHDGRYSWLLNHGVGPEADSIREQWAKKVGMSPPVPNGPEVFAPPSPTPPPDGLPSVEELAQSIADGWNMPGDIGGASDWSKLLATRAATVFHQLLEKHGRPKMLIDGMNLEAITDWLMVHCSLSLQDTTLIAKSVHRLANTPAPVAPKVDPDDAAIKIYRGWCQAVGSVPHDWSQVIPSLQEYCRTVAAKQVKP